MNLIVTNKCYFCGDIATSKEHIPAKCFFTDNNKNNLITVPSCEKHNSDKSEIDDYIRNIITMHRSTNIEGQRKFEQNSKKAYINKKSLRKKVNDAKLINIQGEETGYFTVEKKEITEYFQMLSSGIFFHKYKRIFKSQWQIFPVSFHEDSIIAGNPDTLPPIIKKIVSSVLSEKQIQKIQGFHNERIFRALETTLSDDTTNCTVILMVFYDGFKIISLGCEKINNLSGIEFLFRKLKSRLKTFFTIL